MAASYKKGGMDQLKDNKNIYIPIREVEGEEMIQVCPANRNKKEYRCLSGLLHRRIQS
jgi:hypothetical protein